MYQKSSMSQWCPLLPSLRCVSQQQPDWLRWDITVQRGRSICVTGGSCAPGCSIELDLDANALQRPKSSHALGQWPCPRKRGAHTIHTHIACANALASYALEPPSALQDGKTVEQIEGADAAALSQAISKHCPASSVQGPSNPASVQAASLAQAAPSANGAQQNGAQQDRAAAGGQDTTRRIKQLLASSPILLFMKVRSACLI